MIGIMLKLTKGGKELFSVKSVNVSWNHRGSQGWKENDWKPCPGQQGVWGTLYAKHRGRCPSSQVS